MFMRRCDGCGLTVEMGVALAGWLQVGAYDKTGDLCKHEEYAHVCSWNCLVTLSMDAEELFPDTPSGEVDSSLPASGGESIGP